MKYCIFIESSLIFQIGEKLYGTKYSNENPYKLVTEKIRRVREFLYDIK